MPPAEGYSGPKIFFDSLAVGAYVLQFDSTSDFKRELGDTNTFEIIPPSAGLSKNSSGMKPEYKWDLWKNRRIDGKEIREKKGLAMKFQISR